MSPRFDTQRHYLKAAVVLYSSDGFDRIRNYRCRKWYHGSPAGVGVNIFHPLLKALILLPGRCPFLGAGAETVSNDDANVDTYNNIVIHHHHQQQQRQAAGKKLNNKFFFFFLAHHPSCLSMSSVSNKKRKKWGIDCDFLRCLCKCRYKIRVLLLGMMKE